MFRFPALQGTIDRRMLINYRVDPDTIARVLPAPFRPKLVRGQAVAGTCLIRLKYVRPRGLPPCITVGSENAAHRIAVEWDGDDGQRHEGVYVPRRDTSSRLVSLFGGRLFPGVLHRADFDVRESADQIQIAMTSADGVTRLSVNATPAQDLRQASLFGSLAEASDFFEAGSVAYSPSHEQGAYDGLELCTTQWRVEPLAVEDVRSSFFDDADTFPAGSVTFDHALLMQRIEHQWQDRGVLRNHGLTGMSRSAGGRSGVSF